MSRNELVDFGRENWKIGLVGLRKAAAKRTSEYDDTTSMHLGGITIRFIK
jgi:hypothetical protein